MAIANVVPDHLARGVRLFLGRELHTGDVSGLQFTEVREVVIPHDQAPPDSMGLLIPEDLARALHDALSRHFGGAPETQSLRKDYEHVRNRYDKVVDKLLEQL